MPVTVQEGDTGTVIRVHVREPDPDAPGTGKTIPVDLTDLDSATFILTYMDGTTATIDAVVDGTATDGILVSSEAIAYDVAGRVQVRAAPVFPDWDGKSSRATFVIEEVA